MLLNFEVFVGTSNPIDRMVDDGSTFAADMTRLRAALIAACMSAVLAPSAHAVVGGTSVPAGERGYVAYITIDAVFACTGTLVTPTVVVTAGHCSSITGAAIATPIGQPGQLVTVSLGSNKPDEGEHPAVKQVIVHDDYMFTGGGTNDVALIELATPSTQTPVKVAGRGEESLWAPGTMADIAGFGLTKEDGEAPDTMQQAKVPITTDAYAQAAYPDDWDGATMIGAGFPQGGVDTCQGDSGGPLLVPAPSASLRLVGSASFGEGCARPGKPGVYGRLGDAKLREWIRSKAPDAVAPDAPAPAGAPAADTPPAATPATCIVGHRSRAHAHPVPAAQALRALPPGVEPSRRAMRARECVTCAQLKRSARYRRASQKGRRALRKRYCAPMPSLRADAIDRKFSPGASLRVA